MTRVATIVLRHAIEVAPPTPACFADREQWAVYLAWAQNNAVSPSTAPFSAALIFQPKYNFCADCTIAHSGAMSRAGKCNPSQFRALHPAKVDV